MGAGFLSALLAATAVPMSAAWTLEPEDPWVVWVASDGSHGVGRMGELSRAHGFADGHQEGFLHCYTTAPLVNACTLQAYSTWLTGSGVWLAGWLPPTIEPNGFVPQYGGYGSVGALVGSTQLEITGTVNPETKVLSRCTWATTGMYSFGVGAPAFCQDEYIYPPGAPFNERYPTGLLTAQFHTGLYDPSLLPGIGPQLPSTGSMEYGVGTVHQFLYAR